MKNVLFFILLTFSLYSNAAEQTYMLLPIVGVYDGDTIVTDMTRLPPPLNKMSIRVRGIDTPEMDWRAKCDKERNLAIAAKQFVVELATGRTVMKITDYGWDMYGGRIDANITIGGIDIGQALIQNGMAVPYFGKGPKHDWCL